MNNPYTAPSSQYPYPAPAPSPTAQAELDRIQVWGAAAFVLALASFFTGALLFFGPLSRFIATRLMRRQMALGVHPRGWPPAAHLLGVIATWIGVIFLVGILAFFAWLALQSGVLAG